MIDLFHYAGGDLSPSTVGDLQAVDGTRLGEQRVLRRLLTNPGDYIWHPDYGAGLGQMVGTVTDTNEIKARIRKHMKLEPLVSPDFEPVIKVTELVNGVAVSVQFADATTGQPAVLAFDVNV